MLTGIKALVVDDDDQLSVMLKDYLSEYGMIVTVADNGRSALEEVVGHHFNVIITDFDMPEMNGLQLVKRIKQIDNENNIKIICMTGGTTSEKDSVELRDLVDEMYFKPFNLEKFVGTLRSFV